MRKRLVPIVNLVCALVATGAAQAQAANESTVFKSTCVACHGASGAGNEATHAPPLAGQDPDYLLRQLQNFRAGIRGSTASGSPGATMRAMAVSLPGGTNLAALARYAGHLPGAAQGRGPSEGPMAGKAYFAVCEACHGGRGQGNPQLSAPRLAGLPAWYVRQQLESFRTGERGADARDSLGQQMRSVVADGLSDEGAIEAVSAYVASLPR